MKCQNLSGMFILIILLIVDSFRKTDCILCYNGTFTNANYGTDPLVSSGVFAPTVRAVTRFKCSLTISCPENAMCFVRSWSARASHSWMVQRGCYQSFKGDSLPPSMYLPNRAMTCKYEKYTDGDYKVCLCQADWCNSKTKFQAVRLLIMCSVYLSTQLLHVLFNLQFE